MATLCGGENKGGREREKGRAREREGNHSQMDGTAAAQNSAGFRETEQNPSVLTKGADAGYVAHMHTNTHVHVYRRTTPKSWDLPPKSQNKRKKRWDNLWILLRHGNGFPETTRPSNITLTKSKVTLKSSA